MSSEALDKFLEKYNDVKESPDSKAGDRLLTFGKYKNRTYDYVWENDKNYVAFVLKADSRYWSRVQSYFKEKIEEDFKTSTS